MFGKYLTKYEGLCVRCWASLHMSAFSKVRLRLWVEGRPKEMSSFFFDLINRWVEDGVRSQSCMLVLLVGCGGCSVGLVMVLLVCCVLEGVV